MANNHRIIADDSMNITVCSTYDDMLMQHIKKADMRYLRKNITVRKYPREKKRDCGRTAEDQALNRINLSVLTLGRKQIEYHPNFFITFKRCLVKLWAETKIHTIIDQIFPSNNNCSNCNIDRIWSDTM